MSEQARKKVVIVHGWEGSPNSNWLPQLREHAKEKGFEIITPSMPETEEPKIEAWVDKLSEVSGEVDDDTYFVGHSIGCQAVMRYLEKIQGTVGGILFVAGWLTLTGLEDEEAEEIARPWLETPIDFNSITSKTTNIRALFSDDDPFVPKENIEMFSSRLKARTRNVGPKGHITGESESCVIEEFDILVEH